MAGRGIARRCVLLIRGTSIPLFVELMSSTALVSAKVFPITTLTLFTPVPPKTIMSDLLAMAFAPKTVQLCKGMILSCASAQSPMKVLSLPWFLLPVR